MRSPLLALGALCLSTSSLSLDINIVDYGAVPEAAGLESTTHAMRRALADIEEAHGGTIRVPRGSFYLGPVNLTSNLVLYLENGATLLADTALERMVVLAPLPSWGPNDPGAWERAKELPEGAYRDGTPYYQAMIHGYNVHNVTITGENGTLDGRGHAWWRRISLPGMDLPSKMWGRPHLIQFQNSTGISVHNVTLRNGGFWNFHLWSCRDVVIRYLTILVLPEDDGIQPINTDGIDPDSSQNVLIEDSYFHTFDDGVAIKSGWDCMGNRYNVPSRNITIRRVVVNMLRDSSAAGLTVGSEMSGGVEDVLIEDCTILRAGIGVLLKVAQCRGGYIRHIHVRRVNVVSTGQAALEAMALWADRSPFCNASTAPTMSHLLVENFTVLEKPDSGLLVSLVGEDAVPLHNFSIHGLRGIGDWKCGLVDGEASDNVPPACPELQPASGPQKLQHPSLMMQLLQELQERQPKETLLGSEVVLE